MMKKDPLTIDSAEFCRLGLSLDGELPLGQTPRLLEALSDASGSLRWRATGSHRARAEGGFDDWLHLDIELACGVPCDRCLQRVAIDERASRDYLLMSDEARAARVDAETDEYDVLVADPQFDLRGLIEDEAIMMLPLVALHQACDMPEHGASAPIEDPPPHPFAALAALRRGKDEEPQ